MNQVPKYLLSLFCLFSIVLQSEAQTDCIVNLNEAEQLYSEGKIEKIPSLLSDCIDNGFSKENKINALRLLTLVYLFEDNQIKAEKTLLKLLKINPEFKINKSIDPLEFINLYNSYNTAPVFSIGIQAGINNTFPRLIETYSRNSFNDAKPDYSANGLGFNMGAIAIYHINSTTDISIEPTFSNYSFALTEKVTSSHTTNLAEKINYLDIPVYGSYYFYKFNQFSFFGEFGAQYSLLLSSSIDAILTYNNNEFPDYEGSSIDSKVIRNSQNIMTSIGVGTRVKLNRSNIQLKLRYKFGYINMSNPDFRYSDHELLSSQYLFVDNDFALTNLSINISYSREFYIHNKKPDNKSNYEIIK